jgi:hypothetical protein
VNDQAKKKKNASESNYHCPGLPLAPERPKDLPVIHMAEFVSISSFAGDLMEEIHKSFLENPDMDTHAALGNYFHTISQKVTVLNIEKEFNTLFSALLQSDRKWVMNLFMTGKYLPNLRLMIWTLEQFQPNAWVKQVAISLHNAGIKHEDHESSDDSWVAAQLK